MNNEMKIKKENVLAAYKAAREAGADSTCKVLEELFGKDTFKPKDVTERIKTFEDAIRELGEGHQYVRAYREWKRIEYAGCKDIEAYLKLRIIAAALNEGWEPQFIPGEYRWAPYFILYTKDEYEQLSDEAKARVVYRADYSASASGGVSFACANSVAAYVSAYIGSRLAFKSEELATYAGKQFIDIYADFLLQAGIKH